MNNKILISAVIIVIIIVGGLAYIYSQPTNDAANNPPSNSTDNTGGNVQKVTVSGTDFRFSPSEIRVKNGQQVKITFTNNGQFPHDWKVDEFSAVTPTAQPGETTEVTFTPNQTGTFQYYCAVPGHKDRGMVGNFIVE
ncbi:MAG: cupredoxin domain-containing protein [Patescibacteria group bacterium]|jgi:nitrite reductase (NO-forming)